MFITCCFCNIFLFKKVLTKISCYSAVDIVVSVMVYNVDTVLVYILEQDRQACYDCTML